MRTMTEHLSDRSKLQETPEKRRSPRKWLKRSSPTIGQLVWEKAIKNADIEKLTKVADR